MNSDLGREAALVVGGAYPPAGHTFFLSLLESVSCWERLPWQSSLEHVRVVTENGEDDQGANSSHLGKARHQLCLTLGLWAPSRLVTSAVGSQRSTRIRKSALIIRQVSGRTFSRLAYRIGQTNAASSC